MFLHFTLQTLDENLRASRDELDTLEELAEDLQPYLTESGAATVRHDRDLLMHRWQDLDTDVAQVLGDMTTTFDNNARMFARIGAFETRLSDAASGLDRLNRFYTDDLESAESSIQACALLLFATLCICLHVVHLGRVLPDSIFWKSSSATFSQKI